MVKRADCFYSKHAWLKSARWALIMLVAVWGTVQAEDTESKPRLGIDVDGTYVSKYIWRGYDVFNNHAAFQPSVNADLFGTGFSVNVWGSIPCGSGAGQDLTEVDYTVAYDAHYLEDTPWAMDVGVNYIYYDFPRVNSRFVPDTDEVGAHIAFTKLFKIGDSALVPSYYVGRLSPVKDNIGTDVEGTYHTFALSYDVAVPQTDLILTFTGDINYNDGLFGADHDWSHATLAVATSVEVGPLTISPFLNYQISMDDSVDDEDELYGGVSVGMSF